MTLMVSSLSLKHLFVQDDQNEMKHDVLSHLPLVSASGDANAIVNTTIVFIRSRLLKQCPTELFWSCNTIDACISAT